MVATTESLLRVWLPWQAGQGGNWSDAEKGRFFSNSAPQSLQRYSYNGMFRSFAIWAIYGLLCDSYSSLLGCTNWKKVACRWLTCFRFLFCDQDVERVKINRRVYLFESIKVLLLFLNSNLPTVPGLKQAE
jgi:hypothetical protein